MISIIQSYGPALILTVYGFVSYFESFRVLIFSLRGEYIAQTSCVPQQNPGHTQALSNQAEISPCLNRIFC